MEGSFRINKYLTQVAGCSRRQADELIKAGRVMVNGSPAQLGQLIDPCDEIVLDGRKLDTSNQAVVLAWYKPVGVTCTERDAHAGKTIGDVFSYPVRVTYAGRLDKDSEGLLILTNDGALIHDMMTGSAGHEKEYVVRVNREITDEFLRGMSSGVYLKELNQTTRPCTVKK
ncbi:MAG: pseudouridine synthase, partial [Lachnospiraceae bacterium]|nr:pseudouridine synthase [Lachnospiraceae bacterium]